MEHNYQKYFTQLHEIIAISKNLLKMSIEENYILTQNDLNKITISKNQEILNNQEIFHNQLLTDMDYPYFYNQPNIKPIIDAEHVYYVYTSELWRIFKKQ